MATESRDVKLGFVRITALEGVSLVLGLIMMEEVAALLVAGGYPDLSEGQFARLANMCRQVALAMPLLVDDWEQVVTNDSLERAARDAAAGVVRWYCGWAPRRPAAD
jgi:hypothetical protein